MLMAFTIEIDRNLAAFTLEDKIYPYTPKSCINRVTQYKSFKFDAQ